MNGGTSSSERDDSDAWLTDQVLAEIDTAAKGPYRTFASLAEFKAAVARNDLEDDTGK